MGEEILTAGAGAERAVDQQVAGHSYTRLYVEEIGTFPSPAPILKLMTVRTAAGSPETG
jgi:hypothetical protein